MYWWFRSCPWGREGFTSINFTHSYVGHQLIDLCLNSFHRLSGTYVFKIGALVGAYSSMVLAGMNSHSQPGCPNSQWRVNPIRLQLHMVLIIIFIFACNEGFPRAPSVNYLPESQVNRRKHVQGVDTSKVQPGTCISIFFLEKSLSSKWLKVVFCLVALF